MNILLVKLLRGNASRCRLCGFFFVGVLLVALSVFVNCKNVEEDSASSTSSRQDKSLATPKLSVEWVTDDRIKLSWNKLTDMVSYRLSWGTDIEAKNLGTTDVEPEDEEQASHTVDQLEKDTLYFIKLRASGADGRNSEYNEPISRRTLAKELVASPGSSDSHELTTDPKGSKKLVITPGVGKIEDGSFSREGIAEISIPDSVTSIGQAAFSDNMGMGTVLIPNSVLTIGEEAFAGCTLESITIGDSVVTIKRRAFYNNQLTEVAIPNSVEIIEVEAFAKNDLTEVHIPDSVRTIENKAFAENNDLTSVSISSGTAYTRSGPDATFPIGANITSRS